MRYLILSDIHANWEAVQAIRALREGDWSVRPLQDYYQD